MRRVTTLALVSSGTLAAVAAGAFARNRLRARGPAIPKPFTGVFTNGMPYTRWGAGAKTLLWIGGPTIGAPTGLMFRAMFAPMLRPFVQGGYTAWIVAPGRNTLRRGPRSPTWPRTLPG